jgi:glycosyltransferase involved in cell wall biosynthesis
LGLSKAEKWVNELRTLCRKLRIEGRVIFAGHLKQRELDAIYRRSDFTVLPSVNEGFGLVVVESWLHRKASIVTDRAGVAELIKEKKNGMLFNPDDTSVLASKMSMLLDDPELASKMGQQGYETSKHCTIDEGIRAEKNLIMRLVGG